MCWNQLLMPGLSTGSIYFLTVPSDHTVVPEKKVLFDFQMEEVHNGNEWMLYGLNVLARRVFNLIFFDFMIFT